MYIYMCINMYMCDCYTHGEATCAFMNACMYVYIFVINKHVHIYDSFYVYIFAIHFMRMNVGIHECMYACVYV